MQFGYKLYLFTTQCFEDNDLIDSVNKFWTETPMYFLKNFIFNLIIWNQIFGVLYPIRSEVRGQFPSKS